MNNDGKPTAMDRPGRVPPFGLTVSLPTESDTLGGAGRISFQPRSGWAIQTGFDFYDLAQQATRFISRRSNDRLLFRDECLAGRAYSRSGVLLHLCQGWRELGHGGSPSIRRRPGRGRPAVGFFQGQHLRAHGPKGVQHQLEPHRP